MSSILDNLKAMREKAKSADTKFFASKGGKNLNPGDFKEGKTVIRVAPSHNEVDPPFVPFRSTYLEVELEIEQMARYQMTKVIAEKKLEKKFDVDKVEEITEEKWDDDKIKANLKKLLGESFTMKFNKRVFTANLHGKEGSKDLIDEYIKFVVNKNSQEIGDKDELRKANSPIFGYKDKQGKWIPGIKPSNSFVFYGWDWSDSNKPLYKIEIYEGMMNRIEELYAKFDTEGEPLTVDPFSHPTEGVGIQFDKKKNDKGKWDFSIEDCPFSGKRQSWTDFVSSFALNETQLEQLKEVKSLQEQFGRGTFKSSDFKIQLSGLALFDEKNKYNAFENDEFLAIVEELATLYENNEEEEEKKVENKKAEETKSGKDIDKLFSKKPLKVDKKSVPEPEPESESEEYDESSDDNSFEEKEVEKEEPVKTASNINDKLAQLRANMLKNKK